MSGAGPVIVLAILAQTSSTSTLSETSSVPMTLDEIPLSEEDLRLIEQLDQRAATATEARPAEEPPRFTLGGERVQHVDGATLREVVPRSLGEALIARPLWLATKRDRLPDDRPVLRGRAGTRVGLVLDGISLHHPLSTFLDDEVAGVVDPWMIDQLTVRNGPSLADDGGRPAGAVLLQSAVPRHQLGFRSDSQIELRSADRSSGAKVGLEGGFGAGAINARASYGDFRAPRFATEQSIDTAFQRANAGVRSVLGGRPEDLLGLTLGADFDRLTNVRRGTLGINREQTRRLFFARLDFGKNDRTVSVSIAKQDHHFERSSRLGNSARSIADAGTIEARADVRFDVLPVLTLAGGADLNFGDAQNEIGIRFDGESDELGAYLGAALDVDRVRAGATLRYSRAETRLLERTVEGDAWLTEGRLELSLTDWLAIGAGWAQNFQLPNTGEWVLIALGGNNNPNPERSFTVEAGPALKLEKFAMSITGFSTWVQDNFEPVLRDRTSALFSAGEAHFYGLESRADWTITERLIASGALIFTKARFTKIEEYVPSGQNGFVLQGNLRYELSRGWFEASLRGGIPNKERSPFDRVQQASSRAERWITLGARGGAQIGAGFELILALENAFDIGAFTYGSTIPVTGIDLRAALRHTF